MYPIQSRRQRQIPSNPSKDMRGTLFVLIANKFNGNKIKINKKQRITKWKQNCEWYWISTMYNFEHPYRNISANVLRSVCLSVCLSMWLSFMYLFNYSSSNSRLICCKIFINLTSDFWSKVFYSTYNWLEIDWSKSTCCDFLNHNLTSCIFKIFLNIQYILRSTHMHTHYLICMTNKQIKIFVYITSQR